MRCRFGRHRCQKDAAPGRRFCPEHSELLDGVKASIAEEMAARTGSWAGRKRKRRKKVEVDESELTSED